MRHLRPALARGALALGMSLFIACTAPVEAPKALETTTVFDQNAPARIDALMTSRFETVRKGAAYDRARAMLDRAAELAGTAERPFLRVLLDPRPNAYSNGGKIVYITSGAVLRANDAQLFMLLAHELAHLEAKNLHFTQAEKATIRSSNQVTVGAVRMLDRIAEDRAQQDRWEEEEAQHPFAPDKDPFATDGEGDGFLGSIFGPIFEDAFASILPLTLAVVSGGVSDEATARLINIEADMDARALELGKTAGFAPVEMLSAFRLLHPDVDRQPFLKSRAHDMGRRMLGDAWPGHVPEGSPPKGQNPELAVDALRTIHAMARANWRGPEKSIQQIRAFKKDMDPFFRSDGTFQRETALYQIGYGAFVGIDPAYVRTSLNVLRRAGAETEQRGVMGEVWFGCELLRVRPEFLTTIQRLLERDGPNLLRAIRSTLLDERYAERQRKCET